MQDIDSMYQTAMAVGLILVGLVLGGARAIQLFYKRQNATAATGTNGRTETLVDVIANQKAREDTLTRELAGVQAEVLLLKHQQRSNTEILQAIQSQNEATKSLAEGATKLVTGQESIRAELVHVEVNTRQIFTELSAILRAVQTDGDNPETIIQMTNRVKSELLSVLNELRNVQKAAHSKRATGGDSQQIPVVKVEPDSQRTESGQNTEGNPT